MRKYIENGTNINFDSNSKHSYIFKSFNLHRIMLFCRRFTHKIRPNQKWSQFFRKTIKRDRIPSMERSAMAINRSSPQSNVTIFGVRSKMCTGIVSIVLICSSNFPNPDDTTNKYIEFKSFSLNWWSWCSFYQVLAMVAQAADREILPPPSKKEKIQKCKYDSMMIVRAHRWPIITIVNNVKTFLLALLDRLLPNSR